MTTYFAKLHLNEEKQYEVSFPDLAPFASTHGNTIEEALTSAHDALASYLLSEEDAGENVPSPSDPSQIEVDHPDFIYPVQVDLELEREKDDNTLVKRTSFIPRYLNKLSKEANIDLSSFLTQALKDKLNV